MSVCKAVYGNSSRSRRLNAGRVFVNKRQLKCKLWLLNYTGSSL